MCISVPVYVCAVVCVGDCVNVCEGVGWRLCVCV